MMMTMDERELLIELNKNIISMNQQLSMVGSDINSINDNFGKMCRCVGILNELAMKRSHQPPACQAVQPAGMGMVNGGYLSGCVDKSVANDFVARGFGCRSISMGSNDAWSPVPSGARSKLESHAYPGGGHEYLDTELALFSQLANNAPWDSRFGAAYNQTANYDVYLDENALFELGAVYERGSDADGLVYVDCLGNLEPIDPNVNCYAGGYGRVVTQLEYNYTYSLRPSHHSYQAASVFDNY